MPRTTNPAQMLMFAADTGSRLNAAMSADARAALASSTGVAVKRRAAALDVVAPPPAPMIADADAATVNALVAHHLLMCEGMSERYTNEKLRGIAKELRRLANRGKTVTNERGTLTPATMREAAAILDAMA